MLLPKAIEKLPEGKYKVQVLDRTESIPERLARMSFLEDLIEERGIKLTLTFKPEQTRTSERGNLLDTIIELGGVNKPTAEGIYAERTAFRNILYFDIVQNGTSGNYTRKYFRISKA